MGASTGQFPERQLETGEDLRRAFGVQTQPAEWKLSLALLLDRGVIIEGQRQSLGRDHAQGSLSRPREMNAKSDSEGMRGESPAIFLLTFQDIASHADPKMSTRGRRSIKSPQGKAVVSRYQLPRTTRGYWSQRVCGGEGGERGRTGWQDD